MMKIYFKAIFKISFCGANELTDSISSDIYILPVDPFPMAEMHSAGDSGCPPW